MGWILSREAHGQGIASEAAHAALDWLEARSSSPTPVRAIIVLENQPSIRLAERIGFRLVGDAHL